MTEYKNLVRSDGESSAEPLTAEKLDYFAQQLAKLTNEMNDVAAVVPGTQEAMHLRRAARSTYRAIKALAASKEVLTEEDPIIVNDMVAWRRKKSWER